MGRSLGASIIYGIKIHNEDEGWPYTYNDETYTSVWPSWVEMDDGDEPDDFAGQIEDRLIKMLGNFHEVRPKFETDQVAWSAWYDRQREVKKRINVGCCGDSLETHHAGIDGYMDTYLGFEVCDAHWADEINTLAIHEKISAGISVTDWDATLTNAVAALGFQTTEAFDLKPRTYLLCTYI